MFAKWRTPSGKTEGTSGRPASNNADQLIDLHDVVKTYDTPAGSFTALKQIDLQIARGQFVAIIGKSGSGKSTLINMITGIDRPTSGEVYVGGTAVHKLSEGKMAVWRGRNLGIIFQFFQLLPSLSVVENVLLPMDFCNMFSPRERRERAMQLLEQVGMAEHAHKLPSAISGGQQQRVAIARALANDPPLLIADEPTGNLDSKTANGVFQLFEKLVASGKTIVMVTHDSDLAKRVDRVVIVADGEIVNEHVAEALSTLNVDQLAWVIQKLEPRRYPPGASIIKQGEPADRFYIITSGRVNVFLNHPSGQEIMVGTLDEGQYFGEIGLLHGATRTATVRAARDQEVEVATLDRETFERLIQGSEPMRVAIDQVADTRISENTVGPIVADE